jgi:hypothetical protein
VNIEPTTALVLPFIHRNGTSPADLLEGYVNAMEGVSNAIEALGEIEFNARDYYVHPLPGAWDLVVKQARARREALQIVYDELTAVAVHCSDAVNEREERRREVAR